MHRLTGTLTHLSALSAETTHTLLLPLLTHTTVDIGKDGEGVLLLDSVSGEGSFLNVLGTVDKSHVSHGEELVVLNHGLEGVDGGGLVNLVRGGGTGWVLYENLHF